VKVNELCGLYEEELQRSRRRDDWPQSVPVEMLPIGRFVAWLLQHYEVIPKTSGEANSTSASAVNPTPHDHD
jgi:hypothetical protein